MQLDVTELAILSWSDRASVSRQAGPRIGDFDRPSPALARQHVRANSATTEGRSGSLYCRR